MGVGKVERMACTMYVHYRENQYREYCLSVELSLL